MKGLLLAAVAVVVGLGAVRAETPYLGVQYGLPIVGFNQGSGCTPGYVSCFTVPHGKQLRECRGTFTIKQDNVEVLAILTCGSQRSGSGEERIWAAEALLKGTVVWSTPVISQSDLPTSGNSLNTCWISWQAGNGTGAPIAAGAAFEIQGVCSTW